MRILIVKMSAIGDIVHTLPAFAFIRRALPAAAIDWAAESSAAEILRGNPFIDKLIEFDTRQLRQNVPAREVLANLRRYSSEIRSRSYDVAIDFQGLVKSALIARLSGAPLRFGYNREELREPAAAIFYNRRFAVKKGLNIIHRHVHFAAEALDLEPTDRLEFPIFPEASHIAEADSIIRAVGDKFAVLNVGGGWPTKLWDAARFGHLADLIYARLGLRPVLIYGPNEQHLAERAADASASGSLLTASPGLKALFALCRRASVFVGGDTGPTHIAVAAGAPVVGIFGPTDWSRNGSPVQNDIVVGRNDIGCRENCYRRSCGNWICMDIDVETVFAAIERRLEANAENFRNAEDEA